MSERWSEGRSATLVRGLMIGAVAWLTLVTPVDVWVSDAGEVSAQDSAIARARARFQDGARAYEAEEYEKAIELFKEAYTIKPGARLLLYIARSYGYLGDMGNALDYMVRYSGTSPGAAEEVREQISAVRQKLRAGLVESASSYVAEAVDIANPAINSGQVVRPKKVKPIGPVFIDVPFGVQTNPPGARIYVDDREWGAVDGETPKTLRLFPGKHTIMVEKDFHAPEQATVTVQPVSVNSKPQNIKFELKRDVVNVSIRTEPPTAQIVYINGAGDRRELGLGTFKGPLPAGPAKFVLTIEGQTTRTVDETISKTTADETGTVQLRYDMRDPDAFTTSNRFKMSTLVVKSYLQGAKVSVDGKEVGTTPGPLSLKVAPGLHRIDVSQTGFKTWSTEVSVKPGQEGEVATPDVLEVDDSGCSQAPGRGAPTPLGLLLVAAFVALRRVHEKKSSRS